MRVFKSYYLVLYWFLEKTRNQLSLNGEVKKENCSFFKQILSRSHWPILWAFSWKRLSLFLYLAQTKLRFKAILSDLNNDLRSVYKCFRGNVHQLIEVLEIQQSNYYICSEEYYYIWDVYCPANDIENPYRLLFLNRTCYNGLYRVNKSGSYKSKNEYALKHTYLIVWTMVCLWSVIWLFVRFVLYPFPRILFGKCL
jgi:hypothetical protein